MKAQCGAARLVGSLRFQCDLPAGHYGVHMCRGDSGQGDAADRFMAVLRQIAACEPHVAGDVVDIARQALAFAGGVDTPTGPYMMSWPDFPRPADQARQPEWR